jgi:hypothetical protein
MHKNVIFNVIQSRIKNPYEILNILNENVVIIFENNIIVTAEKVYYHELIRYSDE